MSLQLAREQMVSQQVRTCEVLEDRVLAAMGRVPRELFVPPLWQSLAYADFAVPLAHGKHMLTPMVAGRFLQALDLRAHQRVLEIGTGSGYLSACMAALGAHVHSVELYPDLAAAASHQLKQAGVRHVEVITGDAMSWQDEGGYDAVVLTASLPIYQSRFEQALRPGGRLLVVVGEPPAMHALLLRPYPGAKPAPQVLFETDLEPLEHAPRPEAFTF
jgi:protein-L-isoaspartate(D-aspartate) O-methyltransferase